MSFLRLLIDIGFFQIRIFRTLTGKLSLVYDESLQRYSELQSTKQLLPSMEFGRRLALEKELDRLGGTHLCNLGKSLSGGVGVWLSMLERGRASWQNVVSLQNSIPPETSLSTRPSWVCEWSTWSPIDWCARWGALRTCVSFRWPCCLLALPSCRAPRRWHSSEWTRPSLHSRWLLPPLVRSRGPSVVVTRSWEGCRPAPIRFLSARPLRRTGSTSLLIENPTKSSQSRFLHPNTPIHHFYIHLSLVLSLQLKHGAVLSPCCFHVRVGLL